jgi:hypothetical protein
VIDSVVALVDLTDSVAVASPVKPAKNPVPPVKIMSTVTVAVPLPLAVPSPVLVLK